MKVALHAGQLLQPIPGGIGRYVHSLLRVLPAAGVDAFAFAAGARPPGVPRRTAWVDLGPPHGSVRYEMWHRLRRPPLRLAADVVHATSLVVPPVRETPLVVTVHDVAFLRVPDVSTRRGVNFHRRGLELTRRDADLVISVSAFTRDELLREGFDADAIVVAHLGVDPPPARDDDEIDAAVASVGVRPPFIVTVGTVEPRKDLSTMVEAVERLRSRGRPDLELVIVGAPGWGNVDGIDRFLLSETDGVAGRRAENWTRSANDPLAQRAALLRMIGGLDPRLARGDGVDSSGDDSRAGCVVRGVSLYPHRYRRVNAGDSV